MDIRSHVFRAKVLGEASVPGPVRGPGMVVVLLKMSRAQNIKLRLLDRTHNLE